MPMPVVLHAADLFRPHNDPDDHFDLGTVYALALSGDRHLAGIVIDYPPDPRSGPTYDGRNRDRVRQYVGHRHAIPAEEFHRIASPVLQNAFMTDGVDRHLRARIDSEHRIIDSTGMREIVKHQTSIEFPTQRLHR